MQTTELLLASLYLVDASPDNPERVAATRVRHPDYIYSGDVLRWGSIERSIPILPGLPQVSDARLRVKDQNRKWRDLIVANGARRKIVDITRVPAGGSQSADSKQVFSGEIIDATFGPGYAEFTLKDRLWTFLDEIFPPMIVSEIHPETSPTDEGGMLCAIFGQCRSIAPDPRGVVPCNHVGLIGSPPTADRYGVAPHPVWDVVTVYRNGPDGWEVVDPDEFDVIEESVTAFGGGMTHVFLDFAVDQKGAEIRADVDGAYWDDEGGPASTGPRRNPIDVLRGIMFFFLRKAGINTDPNTGLSADFDADSFQAVRDKFETYGYHCDGTISEALTVREFLGRFLASFNLDIYEGTDGLIHLNFTDADSPAAVAASIKEGAHIVRESFVENLPDVIANQITFRYAFNSASNNFEITRTGYTGPAAASPATIGEVEKDQVDFYYIREAALALDMATRRMQWLDPTSYRQQMQVPLLAVVDGVDLAATVALYHSQGLADGGYVGQEAKIYDAFLDADALTLNIKSVIAVQRELSVTDDSSPGGTNGEGGTGGGGGNGPGECCGGIIYATNFGEEPADAKEGDGDFYLDGFEIARFDGVNWKPWGPAFPLKDLRNLDATLSWVNRDGGSPATAQASTDSSHGGVHLIAEASSATELRCRILDLTELRGQFTLTAAFFTMLFDDQSCGILIRESSSGKIITIQLSSGCSSPQSGGSASSTGDSIADYYLEVRKYTDTATPSSAYYSKPLRILSSACFFKIEQDCDDLIFSVAYNGQHYEPVLTVQRDEFLTADQVGFFANDEGNVQRAQMTLLSWDLTEEACVLGEAGIRQSVQFSRLSSPGVSTASRDFQLDTLAGSTLLAFVQAFPNLGSPVAPITADSQANTWADYFAAHTEMNGSKATADANSDTMQWSNLNSTFQGGFACEVAATLEDDDAIDDGTGGNLSVTTGAGTHRRLLVFVRRSDIGANGADAAAVDGAAYVAGCPLNFYIYVPTNRDNASQGGDGNGVQTDRTSYAWGLYFRLIESESGANTYQMPTTCKDGSPFAEGTTMRFMFAFRLD